MVIYLCKCINKGVSMTKQKNKNISKKQQDYFDKLTQDSANAVAAYIESGNKVKFEKYTVDTQIFGIAQNASGRKYSGNNALNLTLAQLNNQYAYNVYMTKKQIQEEIIEPLKLDQDKIEKIKLDYPKFNPDFWIPKGSKFDVASFSKFKFYDKDSNEIFNKEKIKELQILDDLTLKAKGFEKRFAGKQNYQVFNISQIHHLMTNDTIKTLSRKHKDIMNYEKARKGDVMPEEGINLKYKLIKATHRQAMIVEQGISVNQVEKAPAFFAPSDFSINVPKNIKYKSDYHALSTETHELQHSIGFQTGRDLSGMSGSEAYSKEEVTTELATMAILANYNIKGESLQSESYIAGWAKENPQEVMKCVSASSKGVKDFLDNVSNYKKKLDYVNDLDEQCLLSFNTDIKTISDDFEEFKQFVDSPIVGYKNNEHGTVFVIEKGDLELEKELSMILKDKLSEYSNKTQKQEEKDLLELEPVSLDLEDKKLEVKKTKKSQHKLKA